MVIDSHNFVHNHYDIIIMSIKQVVLCAGTQEGALERMRGASCGFMLPPI